MSAPDYKIMLNWRRGHRTKSAVIVIAEPGQTSPDKVYQGAELSKEQVDALSAGGAIDLPTAWFTCDKYGRSV